MTGMTGMYESHQKTTDLNAQFHTARMTVHQEEKDPFTHAHP